MASFSIPPKLVNEIRTCDRLVVMTGAGVSAESGVPTFRDAQTGLWAKYEPTELATPQAFERDPKLVWDWYSWRREKVLGVKPNPGHFAIAELGKLVNKLTLITQNVDRLHQQAGSDSVIELHGSIMRAKCYKHHHVASDWPDDSTEQPPRCLECGGLMRPDVVWFNESLPPAALLSAIEATEQCNVFFSVGTSSLVHPAASLAFKAAEIGATVVEVNPNETPLTPHSTFAIPGPSGVVLPELVKCLGESEFPDAN